MIKRFTKKFFATLHFLALILHHCGKLLMERKGVLFQKGVCGDVCTPGKFADTKERGNFTLMGCRLCGGMRGTMEQYHVEKNALTPEIYESLREKVFLQHYGEEDVRQALSHTLFSVVVMAGQVPVGIGRVVGDGRIVFFVKDVVVEPSRQHQGIGRMVMEELMRYIRQAGCPNAYVGLMALTGKEGFYEKFGFRVRPYGGQGSGMTQLINQD